MLSDEQRAAFDAVYPTIPNSRKASEMNATYFLAGIDCGRKDLAELLQAASAVVRDTHKQHDEHTPPHKYTAPFGAIAKLSAVLDKHFSGGSSADAAALGSGFD